MHDICQHEFAYLFFNADVNTGRRLREFLSMQNVTLKYIYFIVFKSFLWFSKMLNGEVDGEVTKECWKKESL